MNTELSDEQWLDIERKLQNLMTLEANPGSPGEAAAATEAIGRLLLKYNLTREEVRPKEEKRKYTVSDINFGTTTKWLTKWRAKLAHVVAINNQCRAIYDPIGGRATIVGEPHNIRAVQVMSVFLIAQLQRLGKDACAGQPNNWEGRLYRRSFFDGAVSTIAQRLREQRVKREQEFGKDKSTALVVQVDKELENAITQYVGATKKGTGDKKYRRGAWAEGVVAGHKVNIGKAVEAQEQGRLK